MGRCGCASNVCSRFKQELILLRNRWHIILVGLAFQYVHGIFTQLAYRMHKPTGEPLHDVGFDLIPELPSECRWISEAIFAVLLVWFIGWSFTPILFQRDFSTVLLWTRLLTVLVVCQSLRILSFSSTQLPGPAPHCHLGTLTATKQQVSMWWEHLIVDVGTQTTKSCGDLIFSSHMTFIITGVLAYQHYGGRRPLKLLGWTAGLVLAVLIIAARKHYTVDIVIAWYTVPMVYTLLHVYWHQRQQQQQQYPLLPISSCSSDGCCCKFGSKCRANCRALPGLEQQQQQQGWKLLLPISNNAAASAVPDGPAADGRGTADDAVAAVVGRVPGISPRKLQQQKQQQRYIQIVASC